MKKSLTALLLAATLAFSACGKSKDPRVSETSATTAAASSAVSPAETTTAITTSTTAEATTSYDERMLKMSLDDVSALLRDTYGNDMAEGSDSHDLVSNKNAALGIRKASQLISSGNWESEEDYYLVTVWVFEMDMDSDTYRSLKAGSELKYYLKLVSEEEPRTFSEYVVAVNGQYVLTASEVYNNKKGNQIINTKAPFHFKGVNKVISTFKSLKNK